MNSKQLKKAQQYAVTAFTLAGPILQAQAALKTGDDLHNIRFENLVLEVARDMGIKAPHIYVVNSDKVNAFVIGYIKPSLFVTTAFLKQPKAQKRATLVHEFTHIKHYHLPIRLVVGWGIALHHHRAQMKRIEMTKEERKATRMKYFFKNMAMYNAINIPVMWLSELDADNAARNKGLGAEMSELLHTAHAAMTPLQSGTAVITHPTLSIRTKLLGK